MNVIEEEGSSAAKQILEIALRENVNTIVVDFILGSTTYKLAIILFFPVFLMPAT